jgi:hypothetical protein
MFVKASKHPAELKRNDCSLTNNHLLMILTFCVTGILCAGINPLTDGFVLKKDASLKKLTL